MARPGELIPHEHYAYVTRSAIRLFNEGLLTNVVDLAVEPEYGYTTRLIYDDASVRVTYGNDLGLNTGASCDLAKDKGHAKFMLREIGVTTPEGQEFLLPWWAEQIHESQQRRGNSNMRTTADAQAYLDSGIGYPAYVKPVAGSKGLGVSRVEGWNDAAEVFAEFDSERIRVAVVEEAIDMPDYRVVMLDGTMISAYLRQPLAISGNGTSSIAQLIEATQRKYRDEERDTIIDETDPRILKRLGSKGLTLASILGKNEVLTLMSISNLSAGGTSVDVGQKLHDHWKELSARIADGFGLRICGVDLACADIEDNASDYAVLEVNAAPGLDHYASSGEEQKQIVNMLYATVLNAYPSAAPSRRELK